VARLMTSGGSVRGGAAAAVAHVGRIRRSRRFAPRGKRFGCLAG
jgi:hypothetical protein